MKETTLPILAISKVKTHAVADIRTRQNQWSLALLVSINIGFSSGFIGLIMTGIAYFGVVENAKQLNQIGTWLIAAAFPLVLFGAHALDKIKEIGTDKK